MKNVLEFLENSAIKNPNKIGFEHRNTSKTYAQILTNAKKIGTSLGNLDNSKPVAIMIDKNIASIECIFGVLYCGGYYFANCNSDNCNSINPVAIIVEKNQYENIKDTVNCKNIYIYENLIDNEIDEDFLDNTREKMCDTNPLCVMLETSGEFVTLNHKSVIEYTNKIYKALDFNENTNFGSQAKLCYSMSITELYCTIKLGATYNIISSVDFYFPLNLVEYLNEKRINTIYWTPSAIMKVANWNAFSYEKPVFLKTVLFSGENISVKQLNYWIDYLQKPTFINAYNNTNSVDICTFYKIDREFNTNERIPIGNACDRELISKNDLVKINEFGEMIFDCKKSDLVKRADKIIDFAQIESVINSVEVVNNCAALYDKDDKLIYVIFDGGYQHRDGTYMEGSSLFNDIKAKLPEYIMPDLMYHIDEIPHYENGKINRDALKAEYRKKKYSKIIKLFGEEILK